MFISKRFFFIYIIVFFAAAFFFFSHIKDIAQACCVNGGYYKETLSCFCEFGGGNNCNAGGGVRAQGKRWVDSPTFGVTCEDHPSQFVCGSIDDSSCCAVACPGEPEPTPVPCEATAPTQAPELNIATVNGTRVDLSWDSITGWGTTCPPPPQNNYHVYVKSDGGSYVLIRDDNRTDLTAVFNGRRGTTYTWKVVPNNGAFDGPFNEGTFTILNLVQGWIWDTGLAGSVCNLGGNEATEIRSPNTASVSAAGISGVWNTNFVGHSYEVTNVPGGNQLVCATVNSNNTNFTWRLRCLGTSAVGGVGSGCVTVPINTGVVTANLGFELISNGWYKGISGDIYAQSISLGVPTDTQVLGEFNTYLGSESASVFTSESASVRNSSNQSRIVESNKFAQHLNITTSETWLEKFSFTPPDLVPATQLGCTSAAFSNLNPLTTYRISSVCLNTAINSSNSITYSLSQDGVAVVYVYGSGNTVLTFGRGNRTFRAANPNRKIIFVVGDEVETIISKDLGEATINTTTPSHLQFALISNGPIVFESYGGSPPVEDLSVVVDGPIASSQNIVFNRDKGINNGYPSQVVRYDYRYLHSIAEKEMLGINTGLSTFYVSWDLGD